MTGAVPGEAVHVVRPEDDDEAVEYVANPDRVGVLRIQTDRGYYQTQVRSSYDSYKGADVSVKLFERSTDEEMVGVDFSEEHLRIMIHGPNNRGWQGIRDIVGPDADVVGGVSLNRDEAREVGTDLLYFADNGRLPGPAK